MAAETLPICTLPKRPKCFPSSRRKTASTAAFPCATCSCSDAIRITKAVLPLPISPLEEAIGQFHLQDLSGRYLTELSGGQRQRALIAMVFCQQTDYVLLDEPLNNLDMYYARSLMCLLRELNRKHRRTTVVVLHDINMAAAYADHVVAMQGGQVRFSGSPEEVFTAENIKTLFDMDTDVLDYKGKKLIVHHF